MKHSLLLPTTGALAAAVSEFNIQTIDERDIISTTDTASFTTVDTTAQVDTATFTESNNFDAADNWQTSISRTVIAVIPIPMQTVDIGVCYPIDAVLDPSMVPCMEVELIEASCNAGENPDQVRLAEHGRCMCDSPFFVDWKACQTCLLDNGFRNDNDNTFWNFVIDQVSTSLCAATPTATFAEIFRSVADDNDSLYPRAGSIGPWEPLPLATSDPGDVTVDTEAGEAIERDEAMERFIVPVGPLDPPKFRTTKPTKNPVDTTKDKSDMDGIESISLVPTFDEDGVFGTSDDEDEEDDNDHDEDDEDEDEDEDDDDIPTSTSASNSTVLSATASTPTTTTDVPDSGASTTSFSLSLMIAFAFTLFMQ